MDFIGTTVFESKHVRTWQCASKKCFLSTISIFSVLLMLLFASPAMAQELSAWDKIQASGKLKIAVYLDNAPYSDGDLYQAQGVDVAVAEAIAKGLGLQLQLLPFQADENMGDDLRNMVWKGHYLGYGPADVMLHVPVDPYFIRQNPQVLITDPYARETLVLFAAQGQVPPGALVQDLLGKKIAVATGSGSAATLMLVDNGALRDKTVLYPSGIAAAQAVLQGKADAAYVTQAQAQAALFAAKKDATDWEMMPLPGMPSSSWVFGAAIKKSNRKLAEAVDEQIKTLRNNGTLKKIFTKHGLTLLQP